MKMILNIVFSSVKNIFDLNFFEQKTFVANTRIRFEE